MERLNAIADELDDAGNTVDSVIGWLDDEGASEETIDCLVDVAQCCLRNAAKLRELKEERRG